MTDLEAQQNLGDLLFHEVRKHIHDFIWYLYSTPCISYSQLMIAAWKVESENEKTRDKVKARAMVSTKPVEGTTKLKYQIAQLTATLSQTGWSNSHNNTLSSPQECGHGHGCSRGGSSSHPDSHNGRSGPGQMTQACSLLTECVGEDVRRNRSEQWNWGPSERGEGACCSRDPLLPSATGARGGTTWPGSTLPWHPL